ncbi:MAG: hypothetical protein R3E73_03535 [Porticoccaceae bacterium]|nr:hypothetical protein [Pseudomonadales bacterium]MCP5172729.1 hypothetical protein [Pseudomonadales bacterium]MCP5302203.1 hypothetical protein [Pseudomonadales bacterium]
MLLSIIVIVLRETLEASVLISIMLSLTHCRKLPTSWLYPALLSGLTGAGIYALSLGWISEQFDYVGQEVLNASLQYLIYVLLVIVCAMQYLGGTRHTRHLPLFMALTVAIALVREGGELVVFYSGFLQGNTSLTSAVTSGFIGLALGLSAGVVFYYGVILLPEIEVRRTLTLLLSLIACGMVLQATQLLIQADWLPTNQPLWDSNELLAENSIAGQIAYAIFGYESRPSVVEISFYLVAMATVFVAIKAAKKYTSKQPASL